MLSDNETRNIKCYTFNQTGHISSVCKSSSFGSRSGKRNWRGKEWNYTAQRLNYIKN